MEETVPVLYPFRVLYNFQVPVGMMSFLLEDSFLFWEGENSRKNFRTKVSPTDTYRSF